MLSKPQAPINSGSTRSDQPWGGPAVGCSSTRHAPWVNRPGGVQLSSPTFSTVCARCTPAASSSLSVSGRAAERGSMRSCSPLMRTALGPPSTSAPAVLSHCAASPRGSPSGTVMTSNEGSRGFSPNRKRAPARGDSGWPASLVSISTCSRPSRCRAMACAPASARSVDGGTMKDSASQAPPKKAWRTSMVHSARKMMAPTTAAHETSRPAKRGPFGEHRGAGFAGPLVLPLGERRLHEVSKQRGWASFQRPCKEVAIVVIGSPVPIGSTSCSATRRSRYTTDGRCLAPRQAHIWLSCSGP